MHTEIKNCHKHEQWLHGNICIIIQRTPTNLKYDKHHTKMRMHNTKIQT